MWAKMPKHIERIYRADSPAPRLISKMSQSAMIKPGRIKLGMMGLYFSLRSSVHSVPTSLSHLAKTT